MSYWNAKYPNDNGEYEITFGSKKRETAKAVEKVCAAVMDSRVESPEDVEVVVHAQWEVVRGVLTPGGDPLLRCSHCRSRGSEHLGGIECNRAHWNCCPICGARMDEGLELRTCYCPMCDKHFEIRSNDSMGNCPDCGHHVVLHREVDE